MANGRWPRWRRAGACPPIIQIIVDLQGMALRIDSRALLGVAPHADLRDVALRTLLLRALALWDNGRGRAAGLRKAANFDGDFGRAVRSIWRDV